MSKDSDVSLINTFYQYFLNQTVFELLKFPGFFPYIIIAKFTEVYCKKGVLRSFTKFTWKHLCQSLFLIKLQASGLQLY